MQYAKKKSRGSSFAAELFACIGPCQFAIPGTASGLEEPVPLKNQGFLFQVSCGADGHTASTLVVERLPASLPEPSVSFRELSLGV